MSPLKSSPFRGTRRSLCEPLCIFIKALKGSLGWGLRRGGWWQSRLSNCLHVNFKLNSPCPGTIYTQNANHFSLICYPLFSRHLTVDGKMQIKVRRSFQVFTQGFEWQVTLCWACHTKRFWSEKQVLILFDCMTAQFGLHNYFSLMDVYLTCDLIS